MKLFVTSPKRNDEEMKVMENVKCGGLISSCCPRSPHGKAENKERDNFTENV